MKKNELNERYLNPLTDFGFHRLFGTESSKGFLIDFLNEIIKEEGLIKNIQYLPTEQRGYTEKDRKAVFDIFCINERGEYFIVEMQRAKQPFFRDRSVFYASLPIRKQAVRGVWDFRLKAVYFVAILDFVLFDEFEEDRKHVVEHVRLVRERTKSYYTRKINFVFVELPKFRKTEAELETNFDRWLFSLKNLSRLDNRPDAVRGKIFEELFQAAEVNQLTKEDMKTYKKSVLEYRDVRDAVGLAFEEGEAKGIEKGIASVVQKCLLKNMPLEDIADLTGFSKEQIIRYK
jgi:predicted transposase/invertase (TIGR01784 family)